MTELNPDATLLDQTTTSQEKNELTAAYVREQYDRGTRSLRKQQYEYIRNMSFLDGQQWLQYNRVQNRWSQIPRDPERVQVTFNILRSRMRTLNSKLLSRELVFEVQPGDSDSASVRGARTSEAVTEDLHDDHDWENLRADASTATLVGGTSILAIDWDAKAGQTIDHSEITGESVGTGEICETLLSIAEIAWEPGTKNAETGYWWIRAQALPPSIVQQTYNLPEEPPTDVQGMISPIATLLGQSLDGPASTGQTLVLTYYERPNPQRPNGAICTVVDSKFVSKPVDWYFPFKDRLNIATMRETHVPGQAAGETVFSDACRVQKSYNDAWSNLLEWHKNTANAKLLIPEGTLDGVEDISDLPGEFLIFNQQAGKPEYLDPPTMPQWMLMGIDNLRNELDDILSVHDISRGQAPTNADSGLAYSILAEQDNTPIGHLTREIARAFEKVAHMALEIYGVKVLETRQAKINRDSNPESVEWTGKSLSGQYDVKIPIDQIMPRSHAADFAMAKDLFANKIITDPRDFISVAQQPGFRDVLSVVDPHANKAERENHLISLDRICIPADFDDHKRHIDIHNRFRTTTRYESLPAEEKAVMDEHIKAHEVLAAEQMAAQQAKLGVAPGLAAVPTAGGEVPILDQPFAQAQLGIPPTAPLPGPQMPPEDQGQSPQASQGPPA